jgi:hypothetical protein
VLLFHSQLLDPASILISIRQFLIDKGFVENVRGDCTLHVGIDARYVWYFMSRFLMLSPSGLVTGFAPQRLVTDGQSRADVPSYTMREACADAAYGALRFRRPATPLCEMRDTACQRD